MNKRTRLTENNLNKIVKNCTNKVINEISGGYGSPNMQNGSNEIAKIWQQIEPIYNAFAKIRFEYGDGNFGNQGGLLGRVVKEIDNIGNSIDVIRWIASGKLKDPNWSY